MKPIPIAYYGGSHERLTGAPVALFNLLEPLPMVDTPQLKHPVESTVSEYTLRANGVFVPRDLSLGQRI